MRTMSRGDAVKLRRIATNYFYYTAKPHLLNPIHYARIWNERRIYARVRHDVPELFDVIRTMTPAGSTGCGFSDYWELYSWVRRNAPLWVLECGGGVSSGVIATALAQNQRGRLISLDESRSYLDRAAALLPAHLRPWVEFHHSELGFQRYAGLPGIFYRDVPQHPYEFVFIDGPAGPPRSPAVEKPFNSDFINVLLRTPERSVAAMIDQRITTLWAFRQLMPSASIRYYVTKRLTYVVAQGSNLLPAVSADSERC
jgi:hypothetical protein